MCKEGIWWNAFLRPERKAFGAGDNGYGELGFQIRSPLLRDSRLGKASFADTALHLPPCFPLNHISAKLCLENLFLKFVCWIPHLLEPRVAAKVAEFE
jgi:hypothetical protein